MAGMNYVCLYISYLESLAPFSDEEIGRMVRAMLIYTATGEIPLFDGNERFIWPTLKAQIDRDEAAYQERCEKNRANGAKGGRPKNQSVISETEWFSEKPKKAKEKEKESESIEADKPPAPAKQARKSYGEFGWVKLTDDEYNRLLNDLGEADVKRCIAYVDESAQATGNKNKWRDWNLVVRKCHKQGWGLNQQQKNGGHEHGIDRLARMYREEFG